jgi:hypothetical protein
MGVPTGGVIKAVCGVEVGEAGLGPLVQCAHLWPGPSYSSCTVPTNPLGVLILGGGGAPADTLAALSASGTSP